jgi:uncharacterized protein YbaP (TraB family)
MRFTPLFLFLFSFTLAFSQAETNPGKFLVPLEDQALLWKIEGKGMNKPAYLFGTMHLIEKEYFFFPDKLKKLIEKSEQLIMELPGIPNQHEALKYVQLEDGSFFDFFTPQQTDSILKWANRELRMNESQFRGVMNKMKPFVAVQLATQMHFLGKTESYELTLEKLAKENQIEVKGLETMEEQMGLFDGLSKAGQTEMVMEFVRQHEQQFEETKKLEQLYSKQLVDSLYMLIVESNGIIASENAHFIDDRNATWIPMIEAYIQEKKSFIAVGAGHLGGPKGLIRLFQQRGYQLTPVKL